MKDHIKELEDRIKELENQIWQQQAVIAALLEALAANRVVSYPVPLYTPPIPAPYNPCVPYIPSYPLTPINTIVAYLSTAAEGNVKVYR